MKGLSRWIDPVLTKAVGDLNSLHRENLISVVRYGSTTRWIKYTTDVDLLLIFADLPHRRERIDLLADWENKTNEALAALQRESFDLRLSLFPRTFSEARRWTKIYLDMVDHSVIYLDKDDTFRAILAGMQRWIHQNHAEKILVQGLPVWHYPISEADADLLA